MKRASRLAALLAMGILVATSFASAQEAPASSAGGQVSFGLIGRDNPSSSKFLEYRDVPKGVSLPFVNLFATNDKVDFNLTAKDALQKDQRVNGWANFSWLGVRFDYNQTPHNMGNNAHVIFNEAAEGVWAMSQTLRQAIGDAADKTASAGRTYPYYQALLGPTFGSANLVDISSQRQRGNVELALGKKLPFDLTFSYMRELKTGYRGAGGGDILGAISPVVDVPEPLNEVVQDFGVRAAYNFKMGNVHAAFTRNVYDNRANALFIDNPFRATDVAYTTATSIPGGGAATTMFSLMPDNEASTGKAGFLLKFKRQTRITGDVSLASWTQNAQFLPYGNNSVVKTAAGLPANLTSSLQQQSLNGKINTTMTNFSFMSRPVPGLAVRLRYRTYDLSNKTAHWLSTGDMSGSPDRSFGNALTASADNPYGYANANPYSTNTKAFTGIVSYDFKGLTVEGVGRYSKLERSYREAESGKDKGYALSAVYHAGEYVGIRATVDQTKRSAEGTTLYGFQSDEAERKTTRTGVDIELTPGDKVGFTFAYFRRNVEFPNRPDRIAVSGGVPAAGATAIPNTPSGLLSAKYDSYTAEVDFNPSARAELSAYYTYEKDATTNQWSTTTGVAINNLLNYAGTDKTNSFGASATIHLVPEKWTWSLWASHQKVDGLMDITAREAGAFYTPGRTTLIAAGQGGAADIGDWDDTKLTTLTTQLAYNVAKAWTLTFGYAYEKYDFSDAYSLPYSGPASLMPQAVLIFMKPDTGAYKASVGYATLGYRF
jgi:hypothetical protein